MKKKPPRRRKSAPKKAAEPVNSEIDFDDLAKQFSGQSVHRPLLDDDGNVLVWSGQEITADILRDSEKAGKLDALLDAVKHKNETEMPQDNEEKIETAEQSAIQEDTAPTQEETEQSPNVSEALEASEVSDETKDNI